MHSIKLADGAEYRCADDDTLLRAGLRAGLGSPTVIRRLSSSPAMVCASNAPPVTGPATTSVCWSRSDGIRSMRSWAKRQIVDGCLNN